jgi:tRNA 2-thiocytidine biosynthesis protein TtcA
MNSPPPEGSCDWPLLRGALAGRIPPWLERFLSGTGRAMHRHGMLREGEGILVGVSGGKDSLSLSVALALRRSRVSARHWIEAALVDWEEFPMPPESLDRIASLFSLLDLPFSILRSSIAKEAPGGGFSCYACARARKRLLFEKAKAIGARSLALGHHLDDFAATTLMNLCFRARLEPMAPLRDFFGGEIRLIRPLCELRESSIASVASRLGLPVATPCCPRSGSDRRHELKSVVADLAKMDRLVREKIYRAWYGPGANPEAATGRPEASATGRRKGAPGEEG